MAMYEKGMWEREQCEYVETILHILSKAYQRSHKDRFNIDIKKVKVLRPLEDENPKPIDVMKCLLPEIEKCAENYPELKKIVDMMYEKEIIFCLSEIDNLKRKLHR